MSREERGDNLSCRNLSLLRALNPPWKPSGLLNSGDEWSGRLAARVHKHLSSPCPELYITLTILPFPSLPFPHDSPALPHRHTALMGTFSRHSQHSAQQWVQVGDGRQDLSSTSSSVKISFSTSTFSGRQEQHRAQQCFSDGRRSYSTLYSAQQPAHTTYSR